MPFVQIFLPAPGESDRPAASPMRAGVLLAAEVAEYLAPQLNCSADDVLVQTFSADPQSSRVVIALLRGRPRAHMDRALASLADFLAARLGFDPSAVLVRFESTEGAPAETP